MPAGRPTKYRPEYCDGLLEHMSKGLSYESFAGVIEVSKQTLYDWEKANPEFLDAKSLGIEKARLFWENLGITHIVNESFGKGESRSLNSTVWIFNMKNRFGWRDKQPGEEDRTITHSYADKSDEELDQELESLESVE